MILCAGVNLGLLVQVKGFPTLNFVAKDGTVTTFSGGRTEKELIAYVKEQTGSSGDPTSTASSDDHSEL
jgi:hypothetical protein